MIQVIHRAFDILEYLSQDPKREFSLGEITAYTGLHKRPKASPNRPESSAHQMVFFSRRIARAATARIPQTYR